METEMATFERMESDVRGYCRAYPTLFTKARGPYLYDADGREYIDFLMGAGSLNYGHNNALFKKALVNYIQSDGLTHGLDMSSTAKEKFLSALDRFILKPRELDYKVQFTGPTGTNAVEAAMKIARRCTGRRTVVAFTNAFHGVTLGAVAATANNYYRNAAGVELHNVTHLPFDGYMGKDINTLHLFEKMLNDPGSGLELPAAVILETIQGEGGVNVASDEWLQGLEKLCHKHKILLIVDDIQMGCGRTGAFFSFEEAGIRPDIVTLSKSLSGYGLPLSVVLLRPELDQWLPGEHNGTFRGNNLGFVTATEAIEVYWRDGGFRRRIQQKGKLLQDRLKSWQKRFPAIHDVRGRGMVYGIEFNQRTLPARIVKAAFERGLIIETCGAHDHILKFLPCLAIDINVMQKGLDICESALAETLPKSGKSLSLSTAKEREARSETCAA